MGNAVQGSINNRYGGAFKKERKPCPGQLRKKGAAKRCGVSRDSKENKVRAVKLIKKKGKDNLDGWGVPNRLGKGQNVGKIHRSERRVAWRRVAAGPNPEVQVKESGNKRQNRLVLKIKDESNQNKRTAGSKGSEK